MKNGWEHYAIKSGKVQKSYFRKYSHRGKGGKACETSGCNCLLSSKEKEVKPDCIREIVEAEVGLYGRVVILAPDVVPLEPLTEKKDVKPRRTKKSKKVQDKESQVNEKTACD